MPADGVASLANDPRAPDADHHLPTAVPETQAEAAAPSLAEQMVEPVTAVPPLAKPVARGGPSAERAAQLTARRRSRHLPEGYRLLWVLLLWWSLVCLVALIGTLGYMLVEHWGFLDALYMSVITLTTTGFKEVHPLGRGGELWTILLSVAAIGIIFGTVGVAAEVVLAEVVSGRWQGGRMQRKIENLHDHVIVCGYGRVGSHVARELRAEGEDVVVIDVRPDSLTRAADAGFLHVVGDGTSDAVLSAAGVRRARALVTCIDSDPENVYVTLTARSLNPDIYIVGRASTRDVVSKLEQAGADRAVSPYTMAARRMVELTLRPGVVEFIDSALSRGNLEFSMEEIRVEAGHPLAGQTVGALRARGIFTLAIMRARGDYEVNPSDERLLKDGENLIVTGSATLLRDLM